MDASTRRRVQRNPNGFQPLIILPRLEVYDWRYHARAAGAMREFQDWTYAEVGQTFRILDSRVIRTPSTAEQHRAAGDMFMQVHRLLQSSTRVDSAGKLITFANPQRQYSLLVLGDVEMKSMAGRPDFQFAPNPLNPLDPWGPGVAGGPSSWAIRALAGLDVDLPEGVNIGGASPLNAAKGAWIHECFHCIGIGGDGGRDPSHCNVEVTGDSVWSCPMGAGGGWTWWGRPDCHLCPFHRQQLADSIFTRS